MCHNCYLNCIIVTCSVKIQKKIFIIFLKKKNKDNIISITTIIILIYTYLFSKFKFIQLKLQRDVDFHNNIICFYGVTLGMMKFLLILLNKKLIKIFYLENPNNPKKNYSLVMEYADG